LLDPGAERNNRRRGDQRELVAPAAGENADGQAERDTGIIRRRCLRTACSRHYAGGLQKGARVLAHCHERHQAKFGKHRVTAADARNAKKDAAKAFRLGGLLQLRRRIGDGDEAVCRCVANRGGSSCKKIIHQYTRLERCAGLAGDDEQRMRKVDAVLEAAHLLGIGGVEHVQFGMPGSGSQAIGQNVGAEARSAHAQQQHIGEMLDT
jgi:hypothetical protein